MSTVGGHGTCGFSVLEVMEIAVAAGKKPARNRQECFSPGATRGVGQSAPRRRHARDAQVRQLFHASRNCTVVLSR